MSVTLSEVKRAARAHRAPLAGESAGYLVLALADQVLSAPRLIDANDIQLTAEGGLRVLGGRASSEIDAELSLRRALDGLLLVASSGSAALTRAGRRESPSGLAALVRELEAALIPVNRAAARRALARLQRETARALASGVLPEEIQETRECAPIAAGASAANVEPKTPAIVVSIEPETPAITAAVEPRVVDLPPVLSSFDGALSDESELVLDESPSANALTIALDVRAVPAALEVVASENVLLDEDVEFIDEDLSDALTIARNLEVRPISAAPGALESVVDLPAEACTRPEPVIMRRSLRPLPEPEPALSSAEALPRTPTLGSLAAELPVLAPELIAEMSRREREAAAVAANVGIPVSASLADASDSVICSAPNDDYTEPMPEVVTPSPGIALVVSRKSDLNELLAGFQVESGDTHQGLRRAIKELAELDLTPAPFAALVR